MSKQMSSTVSFLRRVLPPLCFLYIHYTYFIVTCLLTSIIIWATTTPARSIPYVDSLFMVISAITETGLNTINLSQLNVFQQVIIWFLMIIGNPIIVSAFVIGWRKRAFEQRFKAKQNLEWRSEKVSRAEKHRLGGIEYEALRLLFYVIPAYLVLWQVIGALCLGAYISQHLPGVAEENGVQPWWLGLFIAISGFNNCGLSLLQANMIPFQSTPFVLVTMILMILAGNSAFPLPLRLLLWTSRNILHKTAHQSNLQETLQFVLDHPRRVYTHLFPSAHSWYLLLIMVLLSGFDWGGFEFLNTTNPNIASIPLRTRIINGLFQAISIRSAGFNIITVAQLSIGSQVLCLVMVYISVYPVVITMRSSNVYEERSLGIYAEDIVKRAYDDATPGKRVSTRMYFLKQQLRAQLSHDLWWIVVSVFIVACIEGLKYQAQPLVFSVFNIIFEVVSAYGPVGLSIGLPDQNYSFCGAWHTTSKLVLCAVMLRGRHRGLPVGIDKAMLLPGESEGVEGMVNENTGREL